MDNEKIIIVDIIKEDDLLETYNRNVINNKLLKYIIKEVSKIRDNDSIRIEINKDCKTDYNVESLIKKGLISEYEKNIKEFERNNIIQLLLLIFGVLFIFISSLISETSIWKEVILIIGWVPIWEMVDLELFKDFRGIKEKKIITRLLSSKIVEK